MTDVAYSEMTRSLPQIQHEYGDRVRILADIAALTMLARLGNPASAQPEVNRLLRRCYERLMMAAVNEVFPREHASIPTRMEAVRPGTAWEGPVIKADTRVIFVGLARAGTLPAYQGFDMLHDLVDGAGLRVDHVSMQRRTDEDGKVIGVDIGGSKFGGDVDGAIVMLPDPMGATGGSMADAIDLVKALPGTPRAIVGLHLIITPEFIRRLQATHPYTHIFALRLDRGTSSPEALAAVPGVDRSETGCNEVHYIVPGAGGVGELINNSYA